MAEGASQAVDKREPETFCRILEAQKRWKTVEEKLKLFVGKSKMARPVDVVNAGIKAGVCVGRYKISREQAEQIRRAEAKGGHEAGLVELLQILGRIK